MQKNNISKQDTNTIYLVLCLHMAFLTGSLSFIFVIGFFLLIAAAIWYLFQSIKGIIKTSGNKAF